MLCLAVWSLLSVDGHCVNTLTLLLPSSGDTGHLRALEWQERKVSADCVLQTSRVPGLVRF